MRKVERIEVDGMVVVTAADSSPADRANIRAQVKAAAQKARARAEQDRVGAEQVPLSPAPVTQS
ncbi:hypothetical protein ACN28I_30685 [Archangium gephyra]|uniref:hypothetical protein n=1 Tax=Archangium gephyra TaxID=48 RepID=UPI003B827537